MSNLKKYEIRGAGRVGYLPQLDFLRGLSISWVFIYHTLMVSQFRPQHFAVLPFIKFGLLGFLGVNLFFTISGFLITIILIDLRATKAFKEFYIRRFFRIFPLYYFFLGLVILFSFHFGQYEIENLISKDPATPYLLSFTYNWYVYFNGWTSNYYAHFHTLAIEEQFYLFWPLFIFFLPFKLLPQSMQGLYYLCLILRVTDANLADGRVATYSAMNPIILGALSGFHFYKGSNLIQIVRLISLTLVTSLLICLLSSFLFLPGRHGSSMFLALLIEYVFVYLLVLVTWKRVKFSYFFTFIGRYSYGIYIWHQPVIYIIYRYLVENEFWKHSIASYLFLSMTSIFFTTFFCYVGYKVVEQPAMQLREFILNRKSSSN